jgi:hypothetical protein
VLLLRLLGGAPIGPDQAGLSEAWKCKSKPTSAAETPSDGCKILNDYWVGPKKQYLCDDQATIADYFGAALVTLGEVIRCDFSGYPNVHRWLNNVKKLPSWPKVNDVFYGSGSGLPSPRVKLHKRADSFGKPREQVPWSLKFRVILGIADIESHGDARVT